MSSYTEEKRGQEMDNYHVENESVLQELIKFLKEYFEVEQKSVEVQRFAREHPIVTIFLMVTIAMCAVPVVLFGIFVVGSIMFSFLGFLFVEGKSVSVQDESHYHRGTVQGWITEIMGEMLNVYSQLCLYQH